MLETLQHEAKKPLADFIFSQFGVSVNPIPDGDIHRFDIGRPGNKVGWYIYYSEADIQWAVCGDWREGSKLTWSSSERPTEEQRLRIETSMKEAEEKREKSYEMAADIAKMIYEPLHFADNENPYLKKKKVKTSDWLRQTDERLVLPVFNEDFEIKSLQFIYPDGRKQFLKGGEMSGGFCMIGLDEKVEEGAKVYIAEGYATAYSIHEATGRPCIIAFNAGNLPKVAETFKDMYSLTIVADNDESGAGEKYAKASGVPYILIPNLGMDANDYATAGYDLKELLEPSSEQKNNKWLITGDEFINNYSPSQWLIKKWLPARGIAMLYGAPASGKTFVVIDMLLSISTGQPCWFRNKVKQGGVVYLCGEGHEGLRKRLKVWKQVRGVESLGNFAIAQSALDLDKVEGLRQTVEQIRELGYKPSVIAIDTLNRFYSGDENDAQEVRGFLESCSELQRLFECAVMIIHHTGVADSARERARGSSALKGGVDTEILVTKGEDGFLTLKQTKQKDDMPEELKACLKGHPVNGWYDEDGDQLTSATVEDISNEDKMERMTEEIGIIEEAYEVCGRRKDKDGYPHIFKDDMRKFLKEHLGWPEARVKNAFRKEPYRLIGKLLEVKILRECEDGWSIIEPSVVNVLTLSELG